MLARRRAASTGYAASSGATARAHRRRDVATVLVVGLTAAFTARLAAERDPTRPQAEEAEQARLETEQVVVFLTDLFRSTDPTRAPASARPRR